MLLFIFSNQEEFSTLLHKSCNKQQVSEDFEKTGKTIENKWLPIPTDSEHSEIFEVLLPVGYREYCGSAALGNRKMNGEFGSTKW